MAQRAPTAAATPIRQRRWSATDRAGHLDDAVPAGDADVCRTEAASGLLSWFQPARFEGTREGVIHRPGWAGIATPAPYAGFMSPAHDQPGLPADADVIVIGAGLAGLAAARHLQQAGRSVVVLEAAAAPGGRVRTDIVDGFRLDRGFQLYNPTYPEGARVFDHAALDLKGFERGAIVAGQGRRYRLGDPRTHPTWALDALRAPLGGPLGLARFAAYALRCATTDPATLARRTDDPTNRVLTTAGVNADLMSGLVAPFLSGVFLEPELHTSRRFADLILRSFVRGTPSVPARGMQALPDQLAAHIDHLHLNTSVTHVAPGRVRSDQGELTAAAVVVAVGPAQVPTLLPDVPAPTTRACTTWYHVPDQPPAELAFGQAL
ncbi:MAG: FAD-binding protein, partial [Actinomycetota bacterium]|nr:FAD-binding protein [Actinomycetota bacterium]